jgi:N-acetylmuramoyl-L-alanine amidase
VALRFSEHNSPFGRGPDPTRGRLQFWPSVLVATILVAPPAFGCGSKGTRTTGAGVDAAGAAEASDVVRARAIGAGEEGLPPRAEALALAQSIEARALREGAGGRAVLLHATAARVLERVWRVEGRDQDATEAIDLYRAAAHDADAPGACEAALAGALLAGDVAHDASAQYAEVYRAERRFAGTKGSDAGADTRCRREIEEALGVLVAFRPPQRVLEAIDEGLEGEGAIAQAIAAALDGGASVRVEPPQIVRIESWPGHDTARVVLVLDRPAPYRAGDELIAGAGTARTFIDLDGVDLGRFPRDTPSQGIVTRVHAESTSTGSRVLLDLDGRAWRRVFYMHEPYRIVVDVARRPPGAGARGPRSVARVVLDPGHGGRDTGAVGPSGVREKDVTLDVARRVAPVLSAQGLQVMLTRGEDAFVSLEERTARANAFSADLFVSIHCNASESKGRRGVEAYVLDTTRDEIAARVAARENATTQAASAELASILGGMRLADEAQRSTRFAQLLERAAIAALQMRYGDVIDGGVHTAGFYVLVGARMPSVLFETSYLSNAIDEQRLGNDDYRQLLADAIANAVKAYREGR